MDSLRKIAVLCVGTIVTAAVVVSFLELCQLAVDHFRLAVQDRPWLPIVWTPAITVIIVWITVRFSPGAAGSGNQQVKAALDPRCAEAQLARFVSLPIAMFKYVLTALGFAAGLSIGREGPTVQIAASIMERLHRLGVGVSRRFLIAVGGAIGVAVAFKAVIAGVVFALEQSNRQFTQRNRVLFFVLVVLGTLTCLAIEGFTPFYDSAKFTTLTIGDLTPIAMTVISAALLGGVFARLLVYAIPSPRTLLGRWRSRRPLLLAAALATAIALLGLAGGGITYGDGYMYTLGLVQDTQDHSMWFVPLKMVATVLTAWTGAPAGMFSPLLSIGAGIGQTVFELLWGQKDILLLVGMTAFLSAVIRSPLTAGFLAVEVLGAHGLIPLALLVSLSADRISDSVSPPLWETQMEQLLAALPRKAGA